MNHRGQTTQDFAIGVSILVLTLAGVFAFMPAVFDSSTDSVERQEHTKATALAETILEEYTIGGTTNTLEYDRLRTYFGISSGSSPSDVPDAMRGAAGIRYRNANVTITRGDTDDDGDVYDDAVLTTGADVYISVQSTATVTRIVRFEDDSRCDPSCRLIVRVW